MNKRIEGTIVLDGLVEGKLPALPGAGHKLREWVKFAQQANLHLHLEIDGGNFSILADNTPLRSASLGHDPAETVASALGEMLKVFPPAERGRVCSTLRSIEYRKGREVQTLFAIRPDGSIDPQQRVIEVSTMAPPTPLSRRERFLLGLGGLLVLLAAFGISAIFVDYRGAWQRLRDQATPLSAETIEVNAPVFEPWFTIGSRQTGRDGGSLVLTLRRKIDLSLDALSTAAATQPAGDLERRLALDAVARGYVRAELFAADGRFLGSTMIRIAPLHRRETMEISIPLSREPRVTRIVLTY